MIFMMTGVRRESRCQLFGEGRRCFRLHCVYEQERCECNVAIFDRIGARQRLIGAVAAAAGMLAT